MKILIIDDGRDTALAMADALKDIGDVSVCTKPDWCAGEEKGEMPSKEEVIRFIGEADVILLDDNLNDNYRGRDLLPFCEGKKVIGISNGMDLPIQWNGKEYISRTHVAESLREKVKSLMK